MTDILDPAATSAELLLRYRSRAQDVIPPASGAPVLSPAQRRMWVVERLRPGTDEYAASAALRLDGPLDVAALRASLDGLLSRHDVLRTRYPAADGEPSAVVDAPARVPLRRVDLRHTADLPRAVADQVAADRRGLDIGAGPVFAASLLAVDEDAHVLLLTTHHIATDAWSEALLLDELRRGYAGAAIRPPRTRYADVAAWQRERLTAPAIERGAAYWRQRLAGARALDLPTDRPRAAVRDATGAAVGFTVPAEVAGALRALAAEHRATPFMALLAGFHALLARHAGHGDISVGVPVANRARPEVRDVVGLFLNTLVLRADLSDDPSFGELLDRVRDVAVDGLTHQDVPFELLVEAADRDPSRTPLFSAMFVMGDVLPGGPVSAAGVDFSPYPVGDTSAKTDLTLSVAERPDGSLEGAVVYASALFDRATAARFAARYTRLLAAAVASPAAALGGIDLLDDAERDTVRAINDTVVTWPDTTVVDLFHAQVSAAPDAVAVRFGDTEVTYAELDERANRIAARLRGTGAGATVAVCLDRGPDLVAAVLGVLKSGAAYLPLDPDLPPARLAMLARGAAVIVDRDRDLPWAVVLHVDDDLSGEPACPPSPAPAPGSAAYVIHTSGSTGEPKGVVVEHRALANRLRWARDHHAITATDRVLHKTPVGFDVSLWELLLPLTAGASVVVAEPGAHRDPAALARAVTEGGVTVLHFVPSVLRVFLAEPSGPLPTVRLLVCSGEALTGDLVAAAHARFDAEVLNLYGPTEAAIDVTAARCAPGEPVTIGFPVANTRAYVVDAELRLAPVGVPGELVLGGVQLARGYRDDPAATAAAFVPDPFGPPGRRLYRTGDRARLRADGAIEHLGRLDRQAKIGGHRVEPGEVEAALTAHRSVTAAAVTVHSGHLVAHVVPADADHAVLREHLRGLLPDALVPGTWRGLAALPLTPSGKTDHAALSLEAPTRFSHVAPRDARERTVVSAFAAAIGVDAGGIGAHDGFFHIGGDSLRAIRVVGALRAEGFDLAVHDVFSHQSAAALAALAGRRERIAPDEPVAPFALIEAHDRALVPDGVLDVYPMGETQAGMVYEMLANPHATYQNVSCYRVRDERAFDIAVFRAASALLVTRHDILRTGFDLTTYSEAMQEVHAHTTPTVGHTDLRGLDRSTQRARLREHLLAERTARFDVRNPGLVRHHVHEVDGEWWLTHTECHAVLDGWSQTSLIAELVGLYRRLRAGEAPLPHVPPAVRFADFVALERAALDSAADRDFWAGVLASHEKLEIPAAWAGEDGEPVVVTVPYADLEPRLRALAATAGASLKSVLHTAHLAALAAACGVRSFRSGLVVNGRPEAARADEVAGMYLNTVPFTADVTAPTWRELVASVFAGEAALLAHRRYPMPAMAREAGVSSGLIDAAFVHLDFHVMPWGSTVDLLDDFSPSELAVATVTFPGYLHLNGRPGRIRREMVDLLARAVRHALEAMAADGEADPARTGIAPADRERALAAGRATAGEHDGPTFPQIVAGFAETTPDAPALVRGTDVITYADLDKAANRLAHRLTALGVGPDDVVGVLLPRCPEQVIAQLAALKAGAAFLPLDPELPPARLRHMVADAEAAVVLGEPLADIATEPVTGHHDQPDTAPPLRIAPESLAYVIYTSGSTGAPKGVAVAHRALRSLIRHARPHWDAGPGDEVAQFASPSYDAAVWDTAMALATGAALVLPPRGADPGDLRAQAPTATHLTIPPAVLGLLDPQDFPRLRLLVCAGEALPGAEAARWSARTRVVNAYGPTEAAVCATLGEIPAEGVEAWPAIGAPLEGTRAYVLDADGAPVPWGVRGELHLGGPSLARGYLNRPGLSADRFRPDPFAAEPGARMYRTGDIASWTEDGALRYHGRGDHQVKVRGFRVELTEVEHALTEHPSVEAAVVTVHRPGTAEAALVAHAIAPGTTPAQLREHLRSRLPKHMVPTHYSTVDAFPLTPSGKLDRGALPAPQGLPARTAAYAPPRNALETALAQAWQAALHLDRVGVHDDFFDLGGHSLSMMRIITGIRETQGIELTFRTFLENPTISGQVADLGADPTDTATRPARALMWLRRTGTRAPLFCVHPGGGSAHWYQRFLPHIDKDVPVAAFEWPELHHDAELPSVQDMAGRHYAELREARPHGPYRLFAWCGGSTIAAELAARLVDEGEEVTFILLDPVLDAVTRANARPQLEKLRRLEHLVTLIARDGDPADTPANRAEILALYDEVSTDIDEDLGMDLPDRGVGTAWPRTVRIWRETMEAIVLYPHRPFPGRLTLIASDALANGEHVVVYGQNFEEYVARWHELASDGVDVHRVPGDHGGVMKPPLVGRMCAVVNQVIADAERSPAPPTVR